LIVAKKVQKNNNNQRINGLISTNQLARFLIGAAATDALSGLSVYVLVIPVNPAKMAKTIDMPFAADSRWPKEP